ncbi:Uncharacterised protein [Vibrio cholerae]|uniref:Uncharacterized protein n=1 Tax=Vibrio cholerae TaxID=666 RepID=A0A656ALJ3_VIBCL|nr:Uncharacterised protein [Vibrio cholerae]
MQNQTTSHAHATIARGLAIVAVAQLETSKPTRGWQSRHKYCQAKRKDETPTAAQQEYALRHVYR